MGAASTGNGEMGTGSIIVDILTLNADATIGLKSWGGRHANQARGVGTENNGQDLWHVLKETIVGEPERRESC